MPKTLVTRAHICERLRLSYWQSWKLFPADVGGRVWDEKVIDLLRTKSVNVQRVPDYIPSDLITLQEAVTEFNVPLSWLKSGIKNPKRAIPHYRIGERTILIRRSEFLTWCATRKSKWRVVA